jgi:hypothetical protein
MDVIKRWTASLAVFRVSAISARVFASVYRSPMPREAVLHQPVARQVLVLSSMYGRHVVVVVVHAVEDTGRLHLVELLDLSSNQFTGNDLRLTDVHVKGSWWDL